MGVAAEQQAEMEVMIRELEAENRYFTLLPFYFVVVVWFTGIEKLH